MICLMRVWQLELAGDPDLVSEALVLAPDASAAAEAVRAEIAAHDEDALLEVVAARGYPSRRKS